MKIHAIITGATGMVGEGVLHECLNHPDVEKVLVINRRPCNVIHRKLEEVIHSDFFDLTPVEKKLAGYNTCFFCLGVSSIGLKEDEYHRLTYDLTLNFAKTLLRVNATMSFCYVSGAGTSSSEKGAMWARVKGKTENHLLQLPFKDAYMIRPGFMQPTPGLKNALKLYNYTNWLFPVLKVLMPRTVSTLSQVAIGMINAVRLGSPKKVLEVADLIALSKQS